MDDRLLWTLPVLLAVLLVGQLTGLFSPGADTVIARYPAAVTVTETGSHATLGINGSRAVLHFGTVPRGAVVTRRITVNHSEQGTVTAAVTVNGSIAPALDAPKQYIRIPPAANKDIRLTLNTSRLRPGTYTGAVAVAAR